MEKEFYIAKMAIFNMKVILLMEFHWNGKFIDEDGDYYIWEWFEGNMDGKGKNIIKMEI